QRHFQEPGEHDFAEQGGINFVVAAGLQIYVNMRFCSVFPWRPSRPWRPGFNAAAADKSPAACWAGC
ncbi:MAG: hypothetical protein AAB298_02345, partial [Pseudomonadota bacterium]